MVERLKAAIEKARQARSGAAHPDQADLGPARHGLPSVPRENAAWEALPMLPVDAARLSARRIVSVDKAGSARAPFDVLRTRILKVCQENGWKHIAVTSPTADCGKSFIAVNLAFSLARGGDVRTLLIDLDMRGPTIRETLGLPLEQGIGDYMSGTTSAASICARVMPALAVSPSCRVVRDSAELLLAPTAITALKRFTASLAPDVVLYDLPPMLACDDALAFAPNVDAVLLVAGGGVTTADDMRQSEQLLVGVAPVLGIVLNRAENVDIDGYGYPEGAEPSAA